MKGNKKRKTKAFSFQKRKKKGNKSARQAISYLSQIDRQTDRQTNRQT